MVKVNALACALLVSNAAAYSSFTAQRNPLRNLGQKSVVASSAGRSAGASIKMEGKLDSNRIMVFFDYVCFMKNPVIYPILNIIFCILYRLSNEFNRIQLESSNKIL